MSLIAKQLLIVWRRCFDSFKVVVIKTNIVLIYTNIVDSIFRYVCLKYYRIINRRIFIYFKKVRMNLRVFLIWNLQGLEICII